MVRKPAVAHLSLCDELEHRSPRLFDRNVRIGVMRLEQVHAVATESAQARLHVGPNRLGPEIHVVVAVLAAKRPALGEHEDVVAAAQRTPDDLLRAAPAVERRGVDPVDAAVESGVDRAHGVAFVLRAPVHPPDAGTRTDRGSADAHRSDLEIARTEPSPLHVR